MRSITEVTCDCPWCHWDGIAGACEAGDDGDLACPLCFHLVDIHYSITELNPESINIKAGE